MTVVTEDALENCEVPEGVKKRLDNGSTRRPSVIGDVGSLMLCHLCKPSFSGHVLNSSSSILLKVNLWSYFYRICFKTGHKFVKMTQRF